MRTAELRPLGVGEILDVSIKLYLRHALTLIKIVAIFVVPLTVLTVIMQITMASGLAVTENGELTTPDAGALAAFGAQAIFLMLLNFLGTLLATGAAFKAVGDAYLGRTPNAGSSIRFIGRKTLPLLWVSVLLLVLIVIGFFLLVIPGIYLIGSLLVTVPALIFEELRGGKALNRSRELTRGRWWQSFGVFFLGIFLLVTVINLLIGFLFQALVMTSAESVNAVFVLQGFSGMIGSLLTTPLQACLITVLYFDLRVRKEGFDLQLLAERIGSDPMGGAPDQGAVPPAASPPPTV